MENFCNTTAELLIGRGGRADLFSLVSGRRVPLFRSRAMKKLSTVDNKRHDETI
jgi:hypothetical protein